MTPRKYSSEAVAQVRRDDGDLNLYVEAGGIAALRIDTVGQALGIKPWEAFAAITLWKLVDLYEGLASAPDRDVDGRLVVMPRRGHQEIGLLRRSRQALHDATADAIEAAAACTLASEAFQREQLMSVVFAENQQLAAKIYALESVESERQQTRAASRQASKARWSALEDHKQRALKLANSQPFKHRSTAARFAMERIEKGGDGQTYTFETVGGWLKRFGWTAEC